MTWSRPDPATRRVVAFLAAVLLAIPPGTALADDPPAADREPAAAPPELRLDPPTLPARQPPGPTPWRAVAEEGIILGASLVGYAVTRPPANDAHPVPFLDKLRLAHGAWGFDADSLPTNYVGHPVAGLFFYQVARGNRLGVGASLGLTLSAALVWELAEYNELASVHDVVSTSAGGLALGEAFNQLAAWLGQRDGAAAQVASALFQLPRAFHDWRDGAPPAPPERWGLADVAAWTSAGWSWPRPEGDEAELRFGARARLVRAAEVGLPGSGWRTLLDGNVTSLAAELAIGRPGRRRVRPHRAGLAGRALRPGPRRRGGGRRPAGHAEPGLRLPASRRAGRGRLGQRLPGAGAGPGRRAGGRAPPRRGEGRARPGDRPHAGRRAAAPPPRPVLGPARSARRACG